MQNLCINLASVYVFHRNIPNIGSDGLIKATNNIKIRQIHGRKYFLLWIDWALRSSQIQPSMNFWIYSLHIMNIWLAFIADKWQCNIIFLCSEIYYWDFVVSKSVNIYFHSREEVRLKLDSPFTTKTVVFTKGWNYKGVAKCASAVHIS